MKSNHSEDWQYREPDLAMAVTEPLARGLRESRASVTYRWLERIKERVDVPEDKVFPSQELLDHVPLLVDAVADFMEDPSEEGPAADEVMAKSAELGEMRFEQGFSTYQVLKEFEVLGGVILSFLRDRVTKLGFTPEPDDVVVMTHRVYRALSKVQQTTAARHIALLDADRADRDRRLRLIRDMLGTTLELPMARALEGGPESAAALSLRGRLQDLRVLADTGDSSRRQGVPLEGAVREAVRRIRPIAQESDLEVRVADSLPAVSVPDAPVEQCLVAYLTNAIRYCTEQDGDCLIEVGGRIDRDRDEVVVTVRNSGRTVEATDDITSLAPARDDEDPYAPGAGLRFAHDILAAIGGRTWAEPASDPPGAVFGLALPSRREEDSDRSDEG